MKAHTLYRGCTDSYLRQLTRSTALARHGHQVASIVDTSRQRYYQNRNMIYIGVAGFWLALEFLNSARNSAGAFGFKRTPAQRYFQRYFPQNINSSSGEGEGFETTQVAISRQRTRKRAASWCCCCHLSSFTTSSTRSVKAPTVPCASRGGKGASEIAGRAPRAATGAVEGKLKGRLPACCLSPVGRG